MKPRKSVWYVFYLMGTLCWMSAGCKTIATTLEHQPVSEIKYYINPVLDSILADPTIIKDHQSDFFYAYGTEDNWQDDLGSRLIPIVRSRDLVNWSWVGNAFDKKPTWKEKGGLWAPDINYVNETYYLYYSFSTWGDPDPGVGLAIASVPQGPFLDQGKLFSSEEIGVPNSIDPFYFENDGRKYLFWGSFSDEKTQGTYGIELSDDGQSILDVKKKFKIAAGDFEAVMIHQRDGYYYFFGSKGTCCEGSNSKYNVRVARATQLTGPFLDKQGRDIIEREHGTLFIKGNDVFVGPGHNAQLITDDQGTDWFLYHAIDKNQGSLVNGPSRRVLMLDEVQWKDGWPELITTSPSATMKEAPVFY